MNTIVNTVKIMVDLSFPLLLLAAGIATLFLYARSMKKNFKRIDHHLLFLGILAFLVPNILFLFSADIVPTVRYALSGLGVVSAVIGGSRLEMDRDSQNAYVGW